MFQFINCTQKKTQLILLASPPETWSTQFKLILSETPLDKKVLVSTLSQSFYGISNWYLNNSFHAILTLTPAVCTL